MALVGAMEVTSVGAMEEAALEGAMEEVALEGAASEGAVSEGAALEVVWVVDLEETVALSLEMKK